MEEADEEAEVIGTSLNGLALKRTRSPDFTEVVEAVKKCRITVYPGELRMRRDVADCEASEERVRFVKDKRDRLRFGMSLDLGLAGHENQVVLSEIPLKFTVQTPRFYPHAPPAICCNVRYHTTCPQFVDADGMVRAAILGPSWRSVHTLRDVVGVIRSMCLAHVAYRLGHASGTRGRDDDVPMPQG
ncbi:unnamed protein product [Chrysoparadoxa australica]